jgi:hypothetical protein
MDLRSRVRIPRASSEANDFQRRPIPAGVNVHVRSMVQQPSDDAFHESGRRDVCECISEMLYLVQLFDSDENRELTNSSDQFSIQMQILPS